MKIHEKHLANVKRTMDFYITTNKQDLFEHISRLLQSDRYRKGTGDIKKRLRWDIFYATGLIQYCCDTLYKYLDDCHIDTALKSIMAEHEFYCNL